MVKCSQPPIPAVVSNSGSSSLLPATSGCKEGQKLALVIDDWGYSSRYTESFLRYPFP